MQVKQAGEILINPTAESRSKKVDIEKLRRRDNRIVKGRFVNFLYPGSVKSMMYRAYKGDPVVKYSFRDGEIYEIPFGLARHINNDVGEKESEYLLDAAGRPSKLANRRKRTCAFESLDFIDFESEGPSKHETTITDLPPLTQGK